MFLSRSRREVQMAVIIANTKSRERVTYRLWELERLIGLGYTRDAALALMATSTGGREEPAQPECADAMPNRQLSEIDAGKGLIFALSA